MSNNPPEALLFTTPGCPHCHVVLQGLNELVTQGYIAKLTVLDATEHPEQAAELGVRAAPWLRLGPFTLTGEHSEDELRRWAEWASGEEGIVHYVEHLLKKGGYQHAAAFVAADPQRLRPLLSVVTDPDANMTVRLGASALLEAYTNTPELQKLLPQLAELAHHEDHRVRADACYLLGLTGSSAACTYVVECLDDTNEEVREIAVEAMDKLAKKCSKRQAALAR
jgi:thioredoxin-like negative regulator of GroEL